LRLSKIPIEYAGNVTSGHKEGLVGNSLSSVSVPPKNGMSFNALAQWTILSLGYIPKVEGLIFRIPALWCK
jgi:hypothetical protein